MLNLVKMKVRNKYKYGKSSNGRKSEVSIYLQMTADYMIVRSPIDAGVPWMGGFREDLEQNDIFKDGHSKCDGFIKKSFHQKKDKDGKGQALDIVPYIPSIGFCYTAFGRFGIVGVMMLESWEELQEQGKIPKDLYLHWGGLWTHKDPKKLGWDMAHYEIRDYPQIEKI